MALFFERMPALRYVFAAFIDVCTLNASRAK